VPDALVVTEGLSKEYRVGDGIVHALRGVDMCIAPGDYVAIMGPSGSGKSTMMNLLGCLDRPSGGTYRLNGTDVSGLGADDLAEIRHSEIGFVFQSFSLLARRSALENVELPLLYGDMSRRARRTRAAEVLRQVGLADRMDHWPSQLSGGQQQRVAIARALVNSPALILADEPTGALDTRTGFEIMALFQRLNCDGMTVVVVTHEPDIAAFSKRVMRFRDGELIGIAENASPVDAEAALRGVDGRTGIAA
jgi:putative ABC transport system ATP-binding protein